MSAALAPIDVAGRDAAVRERLAEVAPAVHGLLVTDLHHVRWLTGFSGSAGTLVVLPDGMALVVDGRYGDQARAQVADGGAACTVREARTAAALRDELADAVRGLGHLGFDPAEVTVSQHESWATALAPRLVPAAGVVAALRRRKTSPEIARMEAAARAADAALAEAEPMLGAGATEADVRDELEYRMRRHGADGPSYDTIVASGPHAARPHHRPTRRRIVEGDAVVIDVGGLVDGYHSDMTRTYLVGAVPPELSAMHALVGRAQRDGLAAVRPGASAHDVDRVCRDLIAAEGLGAEFTHSTGHGVGLQIHEMPWVRAGSHEPLAEGEVVTVEPGVYREGLGGVRTEDLVVVTRDGCRPLTHTPKDRQCLPSRPTT
ncbi:MAG: putative Xaa-Pro dipeptidase [Actinomycetota bacterium]